MPDKPSNIETDLQHYCWSLYEEYRLSQYRTDKLKEINEGRKRYKGDLPSKTFPWKGSSNKTMGLEAIAVDNLEPRIAKQLFADDEDFVIAEPVGPEDEPNAKAVQDFMHWALRNNIKIQKVAKPFVHNLILDGTVDIIPFYTEKTKTNFKRAMIPVYIGPDGQEVQLPQGGQVDPRMLQSLGITQKGWKDSSSESEVIDFKVEPELVSLSDAFFPDPGDDWWEQPYLRFIYPTIEELQGLSGEKGPYKNISDDLTPMQGRYGLDEKDEDQEDKNIYHSQYTKELRLLECHVKWDGEWKIATFAIDDGWLEVRNQSTSDVWWHSRKPIHRFKIFPETNESMGTGIPAKIRHYSNGIDDLYNLMIDSGTIEVIPWFFLEEGPGADNIDLRVTPGRGIPIPKGSNPVFPKLGVKSPVFIEFINLLLGFFERMISLSDNAVGASTAGRGNQTFRGMALTVQEGNIKHQYQGSQLQDHFADLLSDIRLLYAQYMPWGVKRRVFENNQWHFTEMDTQSIQGNFDMYVKVSDASANKLLQRQEANELYQLLGQNPIIDQTKTTGDLLKAYEKNPGDGYIQQQFVFMMQAIVQFPEIAQMVQQFVQQKQQEQRDQEVQSQAQDNIRRREIERGEDQQVEPQKLIDQVTESEKKKQIQPLIAAQVQGQLFGEE